MLMPNTTAEGAATAMARLGASGLGRRPDGTPQTVSLGLAERIADGVADASALVDLADKRMYAAKQGGRNRLIGPGRIAQPFMPPPGEPPAPRLCAAS